MPETGPAFKEKPNWTPQKNLSFDPDSGKISIEK